MNEQQRCRCFSIRLGSIPNNWSCSQNMRSCHLAPTTWCPGRTGVPGVGRVQQMSNRLLEVLRLLIP